MARKFEELERRVSVGAIARFEEKYRQMLLTTWTDVLGGPLITTIQEGAKSANSDP